MRSDSSNPLDQLTSGASTSSSTSESTSTSTGTAKDENMMKNTNTSKYNTDVKVLGGEEEKTYNLDNNTRTNESTTRNITTEEKDYEEKAKVFHLSPGGEEEKNEKSIPDISSFYSIIFVGVLCTFALLIIALRNFFQKYFELYILNTLKYILM